MPTFKNFSELEKHLQSQIKEVLMDDVAETAKDTLVRAIDKVVYDKYSPSVYERRGHYGGLGDKNLMYTTVIKDGILVDTFASPNSEYGGTADGNLDKIIVSGEGYMYGGHGKAFEKPRDFYAEARKIMRNEKLVKKSVKEGLGKRGIKVE